MSNTNLLERITNEFCLPLTYFIRPDPIIYKPLFIGSFFIGLILGMLISLPLVILFSKHWSIKRKCQWKGFDIESYFMCCRQVNVKKFAFLLPVNMVSMKTFQQTTNVRIEKTEITNVTEKIEATNSIESKRGMVDVLMQKNSDAVLEEVTKQDIEVLEEIEKDQDREKEKMMMNILEKSLIEESDNGTLPNNFSIKDFIENMEKDSQEINHMNKTEMAEANATIKKEKFFKKTTSDIDLGFDKERVLNNRLKREMKKERIKKLQNNFYQANVDNPIADKIKEKLEQFNATWDKFTTLEKKRMAESLNKRRWNRRIVAEKKIITQMEENLSLNESASMFGNTLETLVSNGQLSNKRSKELIAEFKREMMLQRKQLDEDASQQLEEIARKLKEKRVEELKKLEDKHSKEKQNLLETSNANQNSDTESNVQTYLSKMAEMNTELENKLNELDQKEAETISQFLMQVNESRAGDIQEAELDFFNNLKTKANFAQNDVQKLIHHYQMLQKKHAEMCKKICKERESLFQEELQKQIKEQRERKQLAEAEQVAILDEQQTIVTKMLEDNADMDEEKKEEILKNHSEKMQELSNHLETTRIKQEQNLQVILAQRRAHLQELREKKEKAAKEKKQEENKILQEKLNAEIEAAELKLAKEKTAAEEKLRQQLMEETKVILEQQHNELAVDIGKLEIAKARRKALMDRQDNTLQCLQEKLEGLVDVERTPQGLSNKIVQHHQNVMHQLEQQQKAERERHQQILQDRIEQKYLEKQRKLTKEFDDNKLEEFQEQKQKGVSVAASILCNVLVEKRHEENMAALEKEIKMELEKNRRDLDDDLEKKLDKELQQQRQDLLVKLAAISDLDKDEIKDIISEVATETGASNKNKKKLTQNLTKELEKAKTELAVTEDMRE